MTRVIELEGQTMRQQLIRAMCSSLIVAALAACGGSDDAAVVPSPAPTPAPAPAPSGIGPAGGTVTGSNGAMIVVPAGALTQTVDLQVTEISPGTANLPAGVDRVGAVFALTPHDTTFAVPVTVSLPFNPAQVPGGRTVQFLKTTDTARTQWSPVVGATVSGSVISAQVTSFSLSTPIASPLVLAPTGWETVGVPIVTAEPVRLGGLAAAPNGRVAVAYVAGSSGTAGLVGDLRVSEWDGTSWTQLGGALNLTAADGPSLASRSIAYDSASRPVVAWLERFARTLVVQRWNGSAWERLGNPLFSSGAATADPQIAIDPTNDRPIVVITSGPSVTVRDWTGTDWAPTGVQSVATSLTGAILAVSNGGQRLLAHTYDVTVQPPPPLPAVPTVMQVRLLAPDATGVYATQVTGPALPAALGGSDVFMDLASDGTSPFVLTGNQNAGPMLVRRWSGSAWESIGGDSGLRNFSGLAQLRVTPFGLPLIAFRQGATDARRVDGLWWGGTGWNTVASPNATTVDVVGFALGLAKNGLPYVALTQRAPNASSQLANELVVRRLVPTTLTVVVNGPAASGSVSSSRLACPVGSACEVPLPAGTVVALDAVPAAGFSLQSWAGCDAVVAMRCTVTVNQSLSVTATFQ
jgi:hypothetical protein